MPEISVLLPVYNAERFLRGALDSVLAQTFRDFEIIAVDDGSSDGSGKILADYARLDPRIRVLQRANTGIVGALNDGLAATTGTFVARMDADDYSLPERLSQQRAYFSEHPECVALGTDVLYTDPDGGPLLPHYPAATHDEIVAQLLAGNGGALIHPTLMARRAALEKVGGYRARYQWIEDLDLYLRLSEIGQLANLREVHLHYRQHRASVNKVAASREELRQELVNPRRAALGLPPLLPEPLAPEAHHTADWHRLWAFDAARGGNWATARRNAWKALVSAPFQKRNWQCLRYVLATSSTRADNPGGAMTPARR